MTNFKKITAAAVSAALAASMAGCTPSIGSGSTVAMTVSGYDVPAGLFIYYTIQSFDEASNILKEKNGEAPEIKDVKNAKIDSMDATDWIQDKALEYCVQYISVLKEFDDINAAGGNLAVSDEDMESAESMASYYYNADPRLKENGVSLESMQKMAENSFKEQEIFNYYYGFEGTEGCSEDELKDYFDENFARVKYLSISLTDSEGNKVSADEERKRHKLAEEYAEQINKKSSEMDKMFELDAVSDDYNEYIAAQTTTAEGETTTTTTTTTTDAEETTTTTDPYANERLIQKSTTTAAEEKDDSDNSETEAAEEAEETDAEKNDRLFNEFLFNDITKGKAEVYDYSEDTIYVVIRGDLRERMTEDDYWSEDYISRLQSVRYYDSFVDMLENKADQLNYDKNKSAFRRYSPFKLELETEE